jgi:hypothetical protein
MSDRLPAARMCTAYPHLVPAAPDVRVEAPSQLLCRASRSTLSTLPEPCNERSVQPDGLYGGGVLYGPLRTSCALYATCKAEDASGGVQ